MKNQQSSRRSFLQKAAFVTIGLTALGTTDTAANIFESQSPYPDYNPYAPQKTDLRKALSTAATVRVNGTLVDKITQLPVTNAKVEVWHVSPGSKKVGHRGYFYTDAFGQYSFVTDFPNGKDGKAPRIHFRISSNDRIENTQLHLGHSDVHIDNNHWERQQKFNQNLFPTMTKTGNSYKITFANVI